MQRLSLFALALCCVGAVRADDVPILEPAVAGEHWRPAAPLSVPSYPTTERGQACVHLAFRIDDDGRVRDLAVLRAWSSGAGEDGGLEPFVMQAAIAVSQWRFAPQRRDERPIVTAANLAFDRKRGATAASIREHCKVGELARFITQAQRRVAARGNLVLGSAERKRASDPYEIPYDRHGWLDVNSRDP